MFIQWLSSWKLSKPIACSCFHWSLPFRFHIRVSLEINIYKDIYGGVIAGKFVGEGVHPSLPPISQMQLGGVPSNQPPPTKNLQRTPRGTLPKEAGENVTDESIISPSVQQLGLHPQAVLPLTKPHSHNIHPQPHISQSLPVIDILSFPWNRRRKLCSLPVIIKSAQKWGRIENPHYSTS